MSAVEIPSDIYPTTVSWGLEHPADEHLEGYGMTQLVESGNPRWVATLGWDAIASEDGTREQAQRLASWMDEVSSASNVAIVRDRSYVAQGAWTGAPAVAGSSQTGRSLYIRNGTASELMAKRGDYFVVSGQMKRVTRDCRLNASGEGRIWFEPKIVESPANGALLYTDAWCAMYLPQKAHRHAHHAPFFSSSSIDLVSPVVDPDEVDGPYVDIVKCAGKKGWLNPNVVHSRASVGYYLGADGYLHDSKNVCLQSQTFDNASWLDDGTPVITANSAVAPDGTTTADTFEDNSAAATEGQYQPITIADDGASWCASVFVKKKTAEAGYVAGLTVSVTGGSGVGVVALINAYTGHTLFSGATTSGVEDHGTYWRLWASVTNNASGNTTLNVGIYPAYRADLASAAAEVASVGTHEFWGAQAVRGRQPGLYVATTTTALGAPRFEWDTSGNIVGLVAEGARTNLVLWSEAFNNVAFTKNRSSVSANSIAGPDGNTTADSLIEDTASGTHTLSQGMTVANNAVCTSSVYAKAGTRTKIMITEGNGVTATVVFNLSDGTIYSTTGTGSPTGMIQSMGNGIYRCSMTFTAIGTTPNWQVGLIDGSNQSSYTGDGASLAYLWGGQFEESARFPSSYIPTTTASATRSVDSTTVSSITSTLGFVSTEGAVFAEFAYPIVESSALTARSVWSLDDGTSNNRVLLYTETAETDADVAIARGGASQASLDGAALTSATIQKAAVAWAGNDASLYASGSAQGGDTETTVPIVTTLNIGAAQASSSSGFVHIKRLRYYPRRLTAAELAAVTT